MKRSEINASIRLAMEFFEDMRFRLPAFAFWTPSDWQTKGPEYDEICDLGLGWDVTDFGSGDLARIGRTIFTLRNGRVADPRYPKSYAHKVMHMNEGQKSVIHYHRQKMEDICNQAGGNILIDLWQVSADGGLGEQDLALAVSGRRTVHRAGQSLRLAPGESICLPPRTYHRFWAEEGNGPVLSVEVSSVCDDHTDNIFLETGQRFPEILEDEPPQYVLCHEYDAHRGELHDQGSQPTS